MALTETALEALKPRDKPYTRDRRARPVRGGVPDRREGVALPLPLNGRQEKLTLGKYPALSR